MVNDDRILCADCTATQPCNGPIRAHPELPRRCEFFEPDGRQRFPTLWAEHEQARQERARTGIRQAKAAIVKLDEREQGA